MMASLPGLRKSFIVTKQNCPKCGVYRDHMRIEVRDEPSADGNEDSYVKVESWICDYCDTITHKRTLEHKPTEELLIVRRLLKLSSDYEQIRHASVSVEGDRVNLSLRMYPWEIVKAARRVEKAKQTGFGFCRLGDVWKLEQYGSNPLKKEDAPMLCVRPLTKAERRSRAIEGVPASGWR